MNLLEQLEPSSGSLILAARSIPFRDLAGHARLRQKEFSLHSRVLLWTDRVDHILLNLAAANATSSDVYIAHRTMPEPEIRALVARLGITHLLQDDVLEKCGDPDANHVGSGSISVMTSGTTSAPKIATHTLETLLGTIQRTSHSRSSRWMLTYPPTSFAGLQVIFSATIGGGDLVIPEHRTFTSFASSARNHSVTHVSGTPTFWRGLLLALGGDTLPLQQITLGGEAVDQATMDRLHSHFPGARIIHIYASTEAGVGFSVHDGRAGIPADWLTTGVNGVQLRVRDGVLQLRSPRAFRHYESGEPTPLDADGWLNTGDLVQQQGDRLLFVGRTDRRYNIAGFKVSPEEVEAVLLECEGVADVHVSCVPSPISGQVLCASVIATPGRDPVAIKRAVEQVAYQRLERHKIPRIVRIVDSIQPAESGKKER